MTTDVFFSYTAYLFSIAYRMLGSVMDAEDMVQETYLRWQKTAQISVKTPKSYLATIITRLCIDYLRSAQVQRESYIGPWLPEPLLTETAVSTEENFALSESLTIAFLQLLERLSPVERAVFLLREVFEYEYAEIGEMVGKNEVNCRQILRRARQHFQAKRPRFDVASVAQQQMATRFSRVCLGGDVSGLMSLLATDVVAYSDGGGRVTAAQRPIYGADKVTRFILGVLKKMPSDLDLSFVQVNGQPGIVGKVNGRFVSILVLDVRNGRIQNIYTILNPDKLAHLELEL